MKKILLVLSVLALTISSLHAQTTFTYTGIGIWTNTANWSPSYPGTTLNTGDTVIIDTGATVVINTLVTIQGRLFNNGTVNNESILAIMGTLFNNMQLNNTSPGIVRVNNGGVLNNNGGVISNNGTIDNNNGGTIVNFSIINNTINGVLNNNSGALLRNDVGLGQINNNGSIMLSQNGTLFGSNNTHTGNQSNAGILVPGNGIGVYRFDNNYMHQSTARLDIQITGATTAGTDYDQVIVAGNALLAGTLNVSLPTAFEPLPGDSFTILTAGSITSTFAIVNFPTIANGVFNITYTSTEAILTVSCPTTTTYTIAGGWDNGDPTTTTRAIIAEDYNTATVGLGDITACELIINTGATLTVSDTNFISVENDIIINGNLDITNTGSLVQVNEDAVTINNGSIAVAKTTPTLDDRNFVAMSSPVTAEVRDRVYGNSRAVFSIIPSNFVPFDIDFVEFPEFEFSENFLDDNNDYLLPVTGSTATPAAGIGQLIFPQPEPNVGDGAYTLTYTQNPSNPGTLNSGTITVPINYNGPATTNNYNLLGNPYASAIDVTAFINANDAINEVYYWDHITNPTSELPGFGTSNFSMNDISIRNAIMGIAAVNGGTPPGQFMASGQGFGIKADQAEMVAGTPVVFTNSIRVTGNNDGFRNAETSIDIDKLWLNLTTTSYDEVVAQTGIGFTPNATPAIDKGYDSPRVGTFLSLFTTVASGELLGIQARETFDPEMEIALGFSTSIEEVTPYTISIGNLEGIAIENASVFIIDHVLNTIVNLNEQPYTFTAQKGLHTDRFTMVFQDREVLNADEESFRESVITLYPNPSQGQVTLSYTGSSTLENAIITDVNGKIIKRIDLTNFNQTQTIHLENLARGMYFMQIISQGNTVTKKLILR
ncbi:T9SS type A sorting domain-containing protein [uncultured Dokdonia sp.]|uniref:T9SS type A sorting domain-containing protein n=1 Tax=uncultured Dokdonia sp. TaxID=575653 RepID=UPI002612EA44|nr:T9SS type A sorting domain-containing protein [uncultured Dokdonia sp.]